MINIPAVASYTGVYPERSRRDAENHLLTAGGVTYTYDGRGPGSVLTNPKLKNGKRVMKSNGKLYWYGAGSEPVIETDAAGNFQYRYLYFAGMRVAREEANDWVDHYINDALGNARIVYGFNGGWDQSDYYPFGGERIINNNNLAGSPWKFTGKQRDTESGLDNFGARYDSSTMGRFMSPDDPFSDQDQRNPQSWNLYTYARNNPLRFTDADGRACVQQDGGTFKTVGTEGQSCEEATEEDKTVHASAVVTPTEDERVKMFAQEIGDRGTDELKEGVIIMAAGAADVAITGYVMRLAAEIEEELIINSQKQDGHVRGTPQYKNRVKGGKSTSTFPDRQTADKLTRDTWETGAPQSDGSRIKDYGRPIGEGPNGGTQTKVRVTQDASGKIHGTPWGAPTP